jgi:hypothetical protein
MRRKAFWTVGLVALITILVVVNGLPVAAVQTDDVLAGRARLDAYKIYFTEANTEASRFDRSGTGLSRLAGLLERLGAQLYTLEWRNPIPPDVDLIVIAGPVRDLSADETARLWAYLHDNGRLLVLADPIINRTRAFPAEDGLFALTWVDMSVRGLENMIVKEGELHSVEAPPDEVEAGTPTPTPWIVQMPILLADFVTTDLNREHPITQDLQGTLAFFGVRSLEVDETPQIIQAKALAFSLPDYYGETNLRDYATYGTSDYSTLEDTLRGTHPLAAASLDPDTGARIVVIGDREFATNGGGLQTSPPNSPSFVYPANVEFMLNAIAWLLDANQSEMTFPTPGPTGTATITPTVTPPAALSPTPEGQTG